MKYTKLDLLTLLISLFILSSCQNPDKIGLDISPDQQVLGTLDSSLTVTATTVKEDTLITSALKQSPLGYSKDPVFGTTVSNLALSLTLPTDSSKVRFGTNPQLDSAVLVMNYGNEFYGDSVNSNYTINVHQLNEAFNTTSNYYNTKSWDFNPAVVGTKTVKHFAIKDSVRISRFVKGKADTVVKVLPHLRIPLKSEFINAKFFNAGTTNLSSSTKFQSFLKGLYLTIDQSKIGGAGGTVFFVSDSIKLELYYKNDTVRNFTVFPLASTNSGVAVAASMQHDYTGTPVQEQLTTNIPNPSRVYVQALGGVRTKIKFPDLNELKKLGKIVINKAELVLYPDESSQTLLSPAKRLTLYHTDIAGQRQEAPDNDAGQLNGFGDKSYKDIFSFGGFYDKTKKKYTFNITSYLQRVLSGKLEQYDTYIAPMRYDLIRNASNGSSFDPRTTDIYPSGTTAGQTVLGGGTNSSSAVKMQLNIFYTRLDQ
ncbi:DUF4270 domain-containing protein [Rubrolithibacter danxiaensis]|uniref:DUF4270 domain-containing protein n=1 Tax=Rubrolithibacter danxiaensis TaxID=3390805 RepID=UPI003BF85193